MVVLGWLGNGTLTVLRGIHPPFWMLYAMAQVAVFVEFHEHGLQGPRSIADGMPGTRPEACFQNGAPHPSLAAGQGCHPGIFQREGGYTSSFFLSQARASGVVLPAFLMQTGFGGRLLAYAEAPCRAARDFESVVLPPRSLQHFAWLAQEMRLIRTLFDCEGDGRLRPEYQSWAEMTFRVHLYDAAGKGVGVIDFAPSWTARPSSLEPARWIGGREEYRWLPDQFPPDAALDRPATVAHPDR